MTLHWLPRAVRPFTCAVFVASVAACEDDSGATGADDAMSDAIAEASSDATGEAGGSVTKADSTPPTTDTGGAADAIEADSGGGGCSASGTCPTDLTCCGGACKNTQNDPLNCGTCGHVCTGENTMCGAGRCIFPVCIPACPAGQQCCSPGVGEKPKCFAGPTCPAM
jgi:hypothetical protein